MKALVLVPDYVGLNGYIQLMYVHVRNKYYVEHGMDVTVLNFNSKQNYLIDGIKVITLEEYKKNQNEKYDLLILHAPNIKNHYRFLTKFEKNFDKIVFLFHGHEVVRLTSAYPEPYDYNKGRMYFVKKFIQYSYDTVKLTIWRKYIPKIKYKTNFIFVSKSMYNDFIRWTKIKPAIIEGKYSIIYNSVGKIFEENIYDEKCDKPYDYITIRNNLDSSVYCVDIVCRLAEQNTNKKFLIIGKGEYFKHNKIPNNVTLMDNYIQHEDMIKYVNSSKVALMPTRRDTQGVMSCELATLGIPLITSDISVCKEVFQNFKNVRFINNNQENIDLENITKDLLKETDSIKNTMYYQENTCKKEIGLFQKILK